MTLSVIKKCKYSFLYVVSVVVINLSFAYIAPFELYNGDLWTVGSLLAGVVFIFRDYAQKEVGHSRVLTLMLAAAAISYAMSDPFIALASVSAFAISEVIDYLVFTYLKGNFKRKVILSSLFSVPVDTIVFLLIIENFGMFGFLIMCLSKFAVLLFLWRKL